MRPWRRENRGETVFKTVAFVRSATLPGRAYLQT
jgi:hypothetical protein